ncbi:hypothetical protein O0880_21900 [Janthinobacterium sp. SUN118]|uniref:hypothetical protein n=1 Tax=Janthinobacterium sp. SUN118 TaxID=3004100 RepID=UPI0025B006BA|nr:hypothetical protein [Janthinobacterium sp. SUN118]MDN2712083.1 hypothetical protein [Janthinobacterium sp. SUN118]
MLRTINCLHRLPHMLLLLALSLSAQAQSFKLWQPGTFSDFEYKPASLCADCYVQLVEVTAPATGIVVSGSDPACGINEVTTFFDVVGAAVATYIDPYASANLAELGKRLVYRSVRNQVGGSFQTFLDANGPRSPYANCAPIAALIPADAMVTTIHLGINDLAAGPGSCLPGTDCSTGYARFLNAPEVRSVANGGQIVATTFANWSHDRDRVGRMFVVFRMPDGKIPITYE